MTLATHFVSGSTRTRRENTPITLPLQGCADERPSATMDLRKGLRTDR